MAGKLCPLMSDALNLKPCLEAECGWYSVPNNECSILAISGELEDISEILNNSNQ